MFGVNAALGPGAFCLICTTLPPKEHLVQLHDISWQCSLNKGCCEVSQISSLIKPNVDSLDVKGLMVIFSHDALAFFFFFTASCRSCNKGDGESQYVWGLCSLLQALQTTGTSAVVHNENKNLDWINESVKEVVRHPAPTYYKLIKYK